MTSQPWPSVDALLELALDQADHAARFDLVLEPTFLGGVLASPDGVIDKVHFLLGPGDFYDVVHAAIWAAMLRLRPAFKVVPEAVAAAVAHIPTASARVWRLYVDAATDETEVGFVTNLARLIKHAAVRRSAAARLRERRQP